MLKGPGRKPKECYSGGWSKRQSAAVAGRRASPNWERIAQQAGRGSPEVENLAQRRSRWVVRLAELSGEFGADAESVIGELRAEIRTRPKVLVDHLRVCGAIPERYGHDSSEEKLYSKYTDAVICEALNAIGLNSVVLDARADSADVQAHAPLGFSLVADAKAFRLSRTAKNQKDFKVQAMDGWRHGLDHALIVCPNLPTSVALKPNLPPSHRQRCVYCELLAPGHSRCLIEAAFVSRGHFRFARNAESYFHHEPE